MMLRMMTGWWVIALACGLAPLAQGATVAIGASKDATIFKNNPDFASGAGNGLFAGTNGTASARRALVAFDIAGSIPAGAIIQSVQLKLTLGSVAGGGGGSGSGPANVTIGLHELLANWGEGIAQQQTPPTDSQGGQGQGAAAGNGDVTWNSNFHNMSTWSTPGGQFLPTASATANVGTTLNGVTTWGSTGDLIGDVQSWLDNPAANYGWLLRNGDETSGSTFRAFYSSEVATAAFRPVLEVTYATGPAVPEPSSLLITLCSAAALVGVRGRTRSNS